MPLLEAKGIVKTYSKTETQVPVLNGFTFVLLVMTKKKQGVPQGFILGPKFVLSLYHTFFIYRFHISPTQVYIKTVMLN